MTGFKYEKDLPHQEQAIQAILGVFDKADTRKRPQANPEILISPTQLNVNIAHLQKQNGIFAIPSKQDEKMTVLDVMMETGTGKTYTYTKTMFELHRQLGIFKFVLVVPTLSIKAGAENFLKSTSLLQHFKRDFEHQYANTDMQVFTVDAQKSSKKQQETPFPSIAEFAEGSDQNTIYVLLINQGMLNSQSFKGQEKKEDTPQGEQIEMYDNEALDKADPLSLIQSTHPFIILDEPHKFKEDNKTWKILQKIGAFYMVRFGATFPLEKANKDAPPTPRYYHLLYRLTAVDAFNQNLVKGITVHVTEIDNHKGNDDSITLLDIAPNHAVFDVKTQGEHQQITLTKGESLRKLHPSVDDLILCGIGKTKKMLWLGRDENDLSKGIEMAKGQKFSPYRYSHATTGKMIKDAVKKHFDVERELFFRPTKIKPLTLFFIDDIASYRDGKNFPHSLLNAFETCVKQEVEARLAKETDAEYKAKLAEILQAIHATHAGYFSRDNSSSDEMIAKEVQEILHDKEALLSLNNPRRFIFSQWTLREGWDNPNVFVICKLRSSGSEISKLQEVGRGLRLPVNECMVREKDGVFYLNYFVDSSEKDFADKLIEQVNQSADAICDKKLTEQLIEKIKHSYEESPFAIMSKCVEQKICDENYQFILGGQEKLKALYPNAFGGKLKAGKVQKGTKPPKIPMRQGKYAELKALWEQINQKVILQYEFKDEEAFLAIFKQFLTKQKDRIFKKAGIHTTETRLDMDHNTHLVKGVRQESIDDSIIPIFKMDYAEFLTKLAVKLLVRRMTLHQAFQQVLPNLHSQGQDFFNEKTLSEIKTAFSHFLLCESFGSVQVGFRRIDSKIHPTKFTDQNGNAIDVNTSDLGTHHCDGSPLDSYLFHSIYYDSELELANIENKETKEVQVFTKIPKHSIKIPVAGGGTYSPDFAYIVKTKTGEVLNFIIETKNVENNDALRQNEERKIQHAEKLFNDLLQKGQSPLKIKFCTQFSNQSICEVIKKNFPS